MTSPGARGESDAGVVRPQRPLGADAPADAAMPGPGADATPPEAADAGADARVATQDAAVAPDGSTPAARWVARPLTTPPSYLGSVDNGASCDRDYPTVGFEPEDRDDALHPLFLYFVGTRFADGDLSADHDSPAALAVTEALARRGYVALSGAYDNGAVAWLSDHGNQLRCLFSRDSPSSLIAVACAQPRVDCDLGIAAWGHSQGAFVGVAAADLEPRVRGVWATGYGGDASPGLSPERLRVVNGEADFGNGSPEALNRIAGFGGAGCGPDVDRCLRSNGSGWIRVLRSALADPDASSADHCWFDRRSCVDTTLRLEPSWVDPESTQPFALEQNADWLADIARSP